MNTALLALALAAIVAALVAAPRSQTPSSGGVGAAAPPSAEPKEVSALVAVSSAENAAQQFLVEKHGMTCTMVSDILLAAEPEWAAKLDEQISAAGTTRGWVRENAVWVGTAEDAVAGFGADVAFADKHSIWIVRSMPTPHAAELRATTTPAGRTVWSPVNSIMTCPANDPAEEGR